MDDNNISRAGVALLHITDLPDGILVSIANYLAKPSIALFAIAMTADSEQQTQTSKAIISSANWSALDFGDVEKSLAKQLSDNDIDKILRSVDAVNNLRILKLAGCVNISGSGLNVLRSSVAIEQIDMSLVGKHEVPLIEPEPLLSETKVLPILDGIISRGRGSSLKQLEFPKKWRKAQSTQFSQFLERYSNYLTSKRYCCSKCDRVCTETGVGSDWIFRSNSSAFGTQNFTCSQCLNHFCSGNDCLEDGNAHSDWCCKCEKEYCRSCIAMNICGECDDGCFCQKCDEMRACEGGCGEVLCECCFEKLTCHICNRMRCRSCITRYNCDRIDCNKAICFDCVQSGDEGGECDRCGVEYCSSDCRHHIQESRKSEGKNTCLDCALDGTSLH